MVVNPHECNAAIVLKTLEQEAAHREGQLADAVLTGADSSCERRPG